MTQVTVHEAKTHLSRLIEKALRGEEIVIARGNEPVVRLQPLRPGLRKEQPVFGSMRGLVDYMAADFDEPLEDLREYMETAKEARARPPKRRSK